MFCKRNRRRRKERMANLQVTNAIRIGTIAGLGLVVFLGLVELVSGHRVLVLLLNVDFIPLIGTILWPVWMEIIFHLIISWAISLVYLLYVKKKERTSRQQWSAAFILSGSAAFSYFPLAMLAEKPVPAVNDLTAIFFWFLGHGVYAFLLKVISRTDKKQN